jgi:formamidopyrimidine-DNA glycosylase
MPEIPDIEAYLEALRSRVVGEVLLRVRLGNPFLLRTVDPPLEAIAGGCVVGIERLGKRLVFEIETDGATGGTEPPAHAANEPTTHAGNADAAHRPPARRCNHTASCGPADSYFLVLHLMIAGRLHWKAAGAAIPRGAGLAAFDFPNGTLIVTEAGKKRRASLRLVRGREALAELDPGGLEVAGSSCEQFAAVLRRENRTVKRALTDPRIISGIGNAYSDEILHRARLSPFKQTRAVSDDELCRLHEAAVNVLSEWTNCLRAQAREAFPDKVTAFRPDMAVHGRYGAPCPACGTIVRRIVYADNECDYCPRCQTEGRILADRSLSRLLKDDWPRTADEAD